MILRGGEEQEGKCFHIFDSYLAVLQEELSLNRAGLEVPVFFFFYCYSHWFLTIVD